MTRMLRLLPGLSLVLSTVVAACSVTRPLQLDAQPTEIGTYLARHNIRAVLVTDSAGARRWVHHPHVEGDTLRGLRAADMPRETVAIPVGRIAGLAAPRFSAVRTFGLIGGLGAVVGLIAVSMPPPDY